MAYSNRRKERERLKKMASSNGKLIDEQIAQAASKIKENEIMQRIRMQQVQNVGNVMIAVLQNFAPDVSLGLDVLLSLLGATAVNNNVAREQIHTAFDKAFDAQMDMKKKNARAKGSVLVDASGSEIEETTGKSIAEQLAEAPSAPAEKPAS